MLDQIWLTTQFFYTPITDPFTHENSWKWLWYWDRKKFDKGDTASTYAVLRKSADPKPGSCLVS